MKVDFKKRIICLIAALSLSLSSLITPAAVYAAEKAKDEETEAYVEDLRIEDEDLTSSDGEIETEMTTYYVEDNTPDLMSDTDETVSGGALYASAANEYKITVLYDKDAGIPAGAELSVKEASPEQYLSETADALGWTAEDYIFYTRFFDITILKDGVEIEPLTPVTVIAELPDAEECAEALQVVHIDEDGAAEIENAAAEETGVTFEAESFSVYGFGSALHTVMTKKTDEAEISFYGFDNADITENTENKIHEDGFDTLKVYELNNDKKLWVKALPGTDAKLPEGECYALYTAENDAVGTPVIEDITQNSGICAIDENADAIVLVRDTGFRRLDFDLKPDEDSAVKLDGMMPKNAEASAVDVTKQYDEKEESTDVLAAFDITIQNGKKEYQPSEDRPILVTITDPAITADVDIQLWHVKDNGEKEQITEFGIEDEKIIFNAVGFSVYEIVNAPEPYVGNIEYVSSTDDFEDSRASGGFYLCYGENSGTRYITNEVNSNNALIEKESITDSSIWYFEKSGDYYKLYTKINGTTKYLKYKSGNLIELTTDSNSAELLDISEENDSGKFLLKRSNENRWLQHSGSGKGIRYYTDSNNTTNSRFKIIFADNIILPDDYYEFDGESCGVAYYAGGTVADAFAAETPNFHSLVQISTRSKTDPSDVNKRKVLYYDEDSSITEFNFELISENYYKLCADVNGESKYLKIDGSEIELTGNSSEASAIKVSPGAAAHAGKIQLSCGNNIIYYDEASSKFGITTNNTLASSWLNILKKAMLTEDDQLTYSAARISMADAVNGRKYVIYTRFWNENIKQYEFYAIDKDGSLVRVYPTGGQIEWVSDTASTLEWEFTEYYGSNGKPNGYYELYNPYSEKYIAPQQANNQILSDSTIGVQMSGRKNGEFYSGIIAWEDAYYAYAGFKIVEETVNGETVRKLVSCPSSECDTFYFAEVSPKYQTGDISTINAVDNNDFGIVMKMIKFDEKNNGNTQTKNRLNATEQISFLGSKDTKDERDSGMLSTNLVTSSGDDDLSDNYPNIVAQQFSSDGINYNVSEQSLGNLFNQSKAIYVNKLFLENVYNASGYFEYDSCQNFATLLDEDGNFKTPTEYSYKDKNGDTQTRQEHYFTVYKELGTTDGNSKETLKHGEFFPYNIIKPNVFSTKNPENIYDIYKHVLPDTDPRKYERLYSVGDTKATNYYFGMEMSAKFVQTPSGLDDWGHDIVFEFTGDDDFWLYVDGELVIDLGGCHRALGGKVNFRTGKVEVDGIKTTLIDLLAENEVTRESPDLTGSAKTAAINAKKAELINGTAEKAAIFEENAPGSGEYIFKDYTEHTMRVFYMERGASASNLHMRFNLSAISPGHVLLTKDFIDNNDLKDKLNLDLLQYPFQIWYSVDDGNNEKWYQFGDPTNPPEYKTSVGYQNSANSPEFVEKYRPPGSDITYKYVYFLSPQKELDLKFPDDAMKYRIKECAVNTDVYAGVQTAPTTTMHEIVAEGSLKDFMTTDQVVSARPSIAFRNELKDDILKSLYITKELYDASNNLINGDESAKFNYRLYLSNGTSDEMPAANMHKYYVRDRNRELCKWNVAEQRFESLGTQNLASLTEAQLKSATFETSMYGSISNIPAGYTVEVPNLILGTMFYVEERDYEMPVGYENIGYYCKQGEEGSILIDSYEILDGMPNKGRIKDKGTNEIPTLIVKNRVGFEITADKIWTDKDVADDHDTIYAGVYVDGYNEPLIVKQLKSPNTDLRFFFDTMIPGKTLDDYHIREVTLSTTTPNVNPSGVVDTAGITVTPLGEGEHQTIKAKVRTGFTVNGEKIWNSDEIFAAVFLGEELKAVKKLTKGAENKTSVTFPFNEALPTGKSVYDYYVREITFKDGFTPTYEADGVTVNNCNAGNIASKGDMLDNMTGHVDEDVPSFEIYAEKTWDSDEIYIGLYLDDDELLEVRKLTKTTGSTLVEFDYNNLPPDGYTADDYTIRELDFNIAEGGTQPNLNGDTVDNLSTLKTDGKVSIIKGNMLDNVSAVYKYSEQSSKYTVTYAEGECGTYIDENGDLRTVNNEIRIRSGDSITNTRDGGIGIRLFKWDSTNPLKGGKFKLTDITANSEKSYTSDANGLVTVLYDDFTSGHTYILEETAPPSRYLGLSQKVKFTVTDNGTEKIIVLSKENGSEWTDTDWVRVNFGTNTGISKYVDVYNKQYSLDVKKVDESDNSSLAGAKFNLYKQMTSAVGGFVKTIVEGVGTLITDNNGIVSLIPLTDSGKILGAGTYYLREVEAPSGYAKLAEDIKFIISEIGEITGDAITHSLEGGTEKYVLTVQNTKNSGNLKVKKIVSGSLGDRSKQFTFTIHVTDAAEGTQYEWTKNGTAQTAITLDADGRGTFMLAHNEEALIIGLPPGVDITVTEANEDYKTTFVYDDGAAEIGVSKTFRLTKAETPLVFTNTRNALLPTGITENVTAVVFTGAVMLLGMLVLLIRRRKYQ